MRDCYDDIERAKLVALHWSKKDVLPSPEGRLKRMQRLRHGAFLGNLEEKKVRIYMHAKEGDYCVCTTVWACTEDWLVFKDGIKVPVSCVTEVDFHAA